MDQPNLNVKVFYPFRPDIVRAAHQELASLPQEAWHRYNNPFEQKSMLNKSPNSNYPLINTTELLYNMNHFYKEAAKLLDIGQLNRDSSYRWQAVFKYTYNDSLSPHLDADRLDPLLQKRATMLLYLNDIQQGGGHGAGHLRFYGPPSMREQAPFTERLSSVAMDIAPQAGMCILFENTPNAWHGVTLCDRDRYVLTVSFLSRPTEWCGTRKHAYFMPGPHTSWAPELYNLRDKRASDETAAEVWQANQPANKAKVR